MRDAVADAGPEKSDHAAVVFGLLDALYRAGSREENLLRRVVDWATGPPARLVDPPDPVRTRGLPKALLRLTAGDVSSAVDAAIEDGHLRLAILIARAAESDKEDLRADAAAQLEFYGGIDGDDVEMHDGAGAERRGDRSEGQSVLADVATVSQEERLILALLAGEVSDVAARLTLSWYRVFAMQLIFGAGSNEELMHEERISAAVGALATDPNVEPVPPHNESMHEDAAYHILRMYADPTASYPLTSGVYSPGSFGEYYDPMDSRLPWLLHQTLSAIVPRATLPDALRLSDSYAGQLAAAGMPLWSFYVLCSGGPPASVVKNALLRLWPAMTMDRIELPGSLLQGGGAMPKPEGDVDVDGMLDESDSEDVTAIQGAEDIGARAFLIGFMRVPAAWVHEAQALLYRVDGTTRKECKQWLLARTPEGLSCAQDLITRTLFPRAVSLYDTHMLECLCAWLKAIERSARLPNWSTSGGLVLDYLKHLAPETMSRVTRPSPEAYAAMMPVYKSMAQRIGTYMSQARTPIQRHAAVTIADGIVSAERVVVLYNPGLVNDAADDLERVPASPATLRRVCEEYAQQSEAGGGATAALYVAALPVYSPYLSQHRNSPSIPRATA